MGRASSNFSEKALKESRARDKQVAYNDKLEKHGGKGGGINWSSVSAPVLSKPIDGKVIIRQHGYGAEPIGYLNGEPVFERLGIQSMFNVDPTTGTLSPSGLTPETIRFKGSTIPKSYKGNLKSLMNDWANMVNGIEKDIPALDTMPLFTSDHVDRIIDDDDASYDEMIEKYDADHSDAGTIVMSDENVKNIISAYNTRRNSTPVNKNVVSALNRRF